MTDITNILGGAFTPPEKRAVLTDPPEMQLIDAIKASGLEPPDRVVLDGKVHRFSSHGKKGDDAGWYIVYPEGVPTGAFGCWRDGVQVNFRSDMGRELSAAEQMETTRRQREAREARASEQRLKQSATANAVEEIWRGGMAASGDHPYLARKGIGPNGARVTPDGRLMLPLYSYAGEIASLQYIDADGGKKYQPGGLTKACSNIIGNTEGAKRLYIAEGFATAATIHEVTGSPVAVAYSASNLPEITSQWRERLGQSVSIIVVADNDESGLGKSYADQSSAKYGAAVVMTPTAGDANDFHLSGGDLASLLDPPADDWLISADEFCKQPAPIQWHVKHWCQKQSLMMIHGPSGGGKTFMVLDMCLRIAAGKPDWFGHVTRSCAVVYLAGEGHHGLRSRIAAWRQHNTSGPLDMYLSRAGCDLNTPEGYLRVVTSLRALKSKPGVIVVDTLHRFLKGDENSAQDAKSMLDACAMLMDEFGCTVILVHHTGVSDEVQHRARGSSAWRGALDIEISIVPSKDDAPMEIIQRKSKDAEIAAPMYASLESVAIDDWFDEDGDPVSSAVLVQANAPAKTATAKGGEDRQIIEKAWWSSGMEVSDGHPYVSRSALKTYLIDQMGIKESSAQQYITPSKKRLVHRLIEAEILIEKGHGFAIICPQITSILMISKNG